MKLNSIVIGFLLLILIAILGLPIAYYANKEFDKKKKELCVLCDNESRQGLLLCEECALKYPAPKQTEIEELQRENRLLLESNKSLSKTRILTVDVKTSDLEEVKSLLQKQQNEIDELKSVLMFYVSTPRSGLHEDGGNYARRTLEKFTNSK